MLALLTPLGRRLVFVGDYVNRGPDAAGVLRVLEELTTAGEHDVVLLAGNHERALLNYLEGGDIVTFARHGGLATIRSYVGVAKGDVGQQFRDAFPAGHKRLITERLATYYEDEGTLVTHTGFDPDQPNVWTPETVTESSYPELFVKPTPAGPRPMVVCGHYVQRNGIPYRSDSLICLDTGCGTLSGPLTALLLPELEFVTV